MQSNIWAVAMSQQSHIHQPLVADGWAGAVIDAHILEKLPTNRRPNTASFIVACPRLKAAHKGKKKVKCY